MLRYAVGTTVILLAIMVLTVTVLAYRELQIAGAASTVPSAASMPLTKIIYPEILDPGVKPASLAHAAFVRIYIIGAAAIVLAAIGVIVLAVPRTRGREKHTYNKVSN